MKLYGIGGLGTGKLGNQVFAVRSGEQIVRQYNPVVANPQTAAQVQTRSKLKLASQLAAVVAPAIAIPADGLKTKRNEFISRNYPSISYHDDQAQMSMEALELTKGTSWLPAVNATRFPEDHDIECALQESVYEVYDYVVWVLVTKNTDGSLVLMKQVQVAITEAAGTAEVAFPETEKQCFIYAYGIRANNDESRAKYAELLSEGSTNIVSLATSRNAVLGNVTFSRTSYRGLSAQA